MISAVFAEDRSKWPDSMIDYYITKHYADEWLKQQTTLDYVIIQPVSLTNEEVTTVQLAKPTEATAKTVSRQTVAAVLTALVEQPTITKTTLVLSEGTQEISTALQQIVEEE